MKAADFTLDQLVEIIDAKIATLTRARQALVGEPAELDVPPPVVASEAEAHARRRPPRSRARGKGAAHLERPPARARTGIARGSADRDSQRGRGAHA